MANEAQDNSFAAGFRFSSVDAIVLLLGIATSLFVARSIPPLSIIIIAAVGHFFVYCNVLRMQRTLELVWTAGFLVMASLILTGHIDEWRGILLIGSLTLMVIAIHLCLPSYHGVGWRIINPDLEEWWTLQKKDA